MPSTTEIPSTSTRARLSLKHIVPRDQVEDLRQRMAKFLRVSAALAGLIALMAVSSVLPTSHKLLSAYSGPLQRFALVQVGTAISLSALWLLARSPRCSALIVSLIDTAGVRVVSLVYALSLLLTPPYAGVQFNAILPVSFLLLMRAAILPSTPARTAFIGAPCVIPIPLVHWYLLSQTDPDRLFMPIPFAILHTSAWCVVTLLASTLVSKVIFGLEEQVKKASQLGQYLLEEKVGEGGMGVVYKARHALLRRPTAIKLLASDHLGDTSVARFEREVKLASRLAHPNTVSIYDFGKTPEGVFYYAMEYLDGLTLEQLVKLEGPQKPQRVVPLLRQVAAALCEAHDLGLVHRDIKPANIMVCERGGVPDLVKVVDFGLVKARYQKTEDVALSNVDKILGTPLYMAPESLTSPETVDGRTDLYALGAVAWFLLVGHPVFQGRTPAEVLGHQLHTPPQSLLEVAPHPVPPALNDIILRCLEKDAAKRPQTAQELCALLEGCCEDTWKTEDAREWWATRGRALLREQAERRAAARQEHESARTLAVDPRDRSPSPTPDKSTVRT